MTKIIKKKSESTDEEIESSQHEKPYKKNFEKNRLITAEGWRRMMLKSAGKRK